MNTTSIAYWGTTGLVSLAMLASSGMYLTGGMDEAMTALGYPAYFVTILGAWKMLVAPALLSPGFAVLKQWCYAGLFFTLTGAAMSHAAVGDGIGEIMAPLVMLAFTLVSYSLHAKVRLEDAPAREPLAA